MGRPTGGRLARDTSSSDQNTVRAMRILVLSNLYPPYFLGGYELACAEVVDGLRARGHTLTVLTGWRGLRRPTVGPRVLRLLSVRFHPDPPYPNRVLQLSWYLWNRVIVHVAVWRYRPDVIMIFNPSNLGSFMLDWLHRQHVPVVHDISDTWLTHSYSGDPWFRIYQHNPYTLRQRVIRMVLTFTLAPLLHRRPSRLQLHRSYFRSAYLRRQFSNAGLARGDELVIHHGVHVAPDPPVESHPDPLGIVFTGRVTSSKGVHVLLGALALTDAHTIRHQYVTVIGPRIEEDYWQHLQVLAAQLPATLTVTFTDRLSRTQAMALTQQHSIFVFPVLWDEPFSIALLEAMAAGMAVIATATGGSPELLRHGENALVVPPNDPQALAAALQALLTDRVLFQRLRLGAWATARRFSFQQSIERIEQHLKHEVLCSP